jgi:hypothetical protein
VEGVVSFDKGMEKQLAKGGEQRDRGRNRSMEGMER